MNFKYEFNYYFYHLIVEFIKYNFFFIIYNFMIRLILNLILKFLRKVFHMHEIDI